MITIMLSVFALFAIVWVFRAAPTDSVLESYEGYDPDFSPRISSQKIEDVNFRKSPLSDNIEWPSLLHTVVEGYPMERNLQEIIESWNPDYPDIPANFRETIQHFNFSDPYERQLAVLFRDAEVPFKIYNVPEVDKISMKWTDSYLSKQFSKSDFRIEKSSTNHFMFWSSPQWRGMGSFKPPTEVITDLNFDSWRALAKKADDLKLANDSTHFYFMSNAQPGDRKHTFIARDLNFFSTPKENFFITNVAANKGIQCRFGMRGVTAATHYDTGKNMVAMLHGAKRYILAAPQHCKYLGIISDPQHPSFRHSVIDWSDPKQGKSNGFHHVPAIDTIIRQGEVLYIPSFWFHFIVSLNYSIQCNSRSGIPYDRKGQADIEKCFGSKLNLQTYVLECNIYLLLLFF